MVKPENNMPRFLRELQQAGRRANFSLRVARSLERQESRGVVVSLFTSHSLFG